MKKYWILSNSFYASVEMMIIFILHSVNVVILTDFPALNHNFIILLGYSEWYFSLFLKQFAEISIKVTTSMFLRIGIAVLDFLLYSILSCFYMVHCWHCILYLKCFPSCIFYRDWFKKNWYQFIFKHLVESIHESIWLYKFEIVYIIVWVCLSLYWYQN